MLNTICKPIFVCFATWVFAGSLVLWTLPSVLEQAGVQEAAIDPIGGASTDEKVIKELMTLLLEQENFAINKLEKVVKQASVAAIMVDLYRDYATQAEPDCKDLFDIDNNYMTATIAMEPYGKINSTGFDPATNGARPITNRDVKDKKLHLVLERIQDVLGEFHPEPIKSPRIPGLTFEFQGAVNDGGPANLKHAQFICLIKPE